MVFALCPYSKEPHNVSMPRQSSWNHASRLGQSWLYPERATKACIYTHSCCLMRLVLSVPSGCPIRRKQPHHPPCLPQLLAALTGRLGKSFTFLSAFGSWVIFVLFCFFFPMHLWFEVTFSVFPIENIFMLKRKKGRGLSASLSLTKLVGFSFDVQLKYLQSSPKERQL